MLVTDEMLASAQDPEDQRALIVSLVEHIKLAAAAAPVATIKLLRHTIDDLSAMPYSPSDNVRRYDQTPSATSSSGSGSKLSMSSVSPDLTDDVRSKLSISFSSIEEADPRDQARDLVHLGFTNEKKLQTKDAEIQQLEKRLLQAKAERDTIQV